MELTNHVELNFSPHFPVVLLFANAQSATWANPKWRLPAELPVIHATTPLPYKNLDGYGCSLRAGLNFRPYRLKSDLDFGVDNFWTVRRLIKFSSSPSGSVSTQQLNARIYNRSEIRPVPCECSLIFVHTDKTLVSNTMNGFFLPKRISPQESAPSSDMNSPREHNLVITEFNRGLIPYMRCARILRTPALLCLLLFCSFTCLMLWMIYVQFSTLPGFMLQPLRTIDQSFNDSLMSIGGVSRPNPETKDVDDLTLVSLMNEKPPRETEAISNANLLPILDFQDLGINKKKVMLLIIVSTAPARFDRRQAIRGTWWKHCTGDMVSGCRNAINFRLYPRPPPPPPPSPSYSWLALSRNEK